ncbi:hypothetical protein DYB38_004819 [Aphanomyces astaci]|uniref:Uncharacterized protein n=1 Tax=Aphanomyces astaci TaxID=112090 RepID=A0A397DXT0_APHAT|nr:hypothetical protein DYB38_004819 [Aphanomyces astaci]
MQVRHLSSFKTSTPTENEDQTLRDGVFLHGGKQWRGIAQLFHHRKSVRDCQRRWYALTQEATVKLPWTEAEDEAVLALVHKLGPHKWGVIASYLPGRSGKQCRERCVQPPSHHILATLQAKHGNRWSLIAEHLPGRTDNAVKNHWHASVKKWKDRKGSSLVTTITAQPILAPSISHPPDCSNNRMTSSASPTAVDDPSFLHKLTLLPNQPDSISLDMLWTTNVDDEGKASVDNFPEMGTPEIAIADDEWFQDLDWHCFDDETLLDTELYLV